MITLMWCCDDIGLFDFGVSLGALSFTLVAVFCLLLDAKVLLAAQWTANFLVCLIMQTNKILANYLYALVSVEMNDDGKEKRYLLYSYEGIMGLLFNKLLNSLWLRISIGINLTLADSTCSASICEIFVASDLLLCITDDTEYPESDVFNCWINRLN